MYLSCACDHSVFVCVCVFEVNDRAPIFIYFRRTRGQQKLIQYWIEWEKHVYDMSSYIYTCNIIIIIHFVWLDGWLAASVYRLSSVSQFFFAHSVLSLCRCCCCLSMLLLLYLGSFELIRTEYDKITEHFAVIRSCSLLLLLLLLLIMGRSWWWRRKKLCLRIFFLSHLFCMLGVLVQTICICAGKIFAHTLEHTYIYNDLWAVRIWTLQHVNSHLCFFFIRSSLVCVAATLLFSQCSEILFFFCSSNLLFLSFGLANFSSPSTYY